MIVSPEPHVATDAAAPTGVVPLRLATWNLNHWRQPLLPSDTRRGAWDYLAATMGAQVALVQEAVPPVEFGSERAVYGELAGHRNWGSAIVALDPAISVEPLRSVRIPWSRRRYLLANTHPGSVAVAQLRVPGIQPISLVSVYGVMDGSAVSTMLRIVADLVPLFDSPYGSRVILAGDLNISRSTKYPNQLARAEAVLTAIRSLGLIEAKGLIPEPLAGAPDCACGNGPACGHVGTWGSAELDYVFVSPSLADQVTAVSLDRRPIESGLSDHVPLVLDLALSPKRTAHGWDEESFAEEIGRRHGTGARDVVEKLTNWADQTERELGEAAGVRTKTLTRFPTNWITTEPELRFPVDLELEPKASQPTISIRARGDVVIQFGDMHQPPFDTDAGRNELRLALNGMAGVDIPETQSRGWPTFPLAVLEQPSNLAILVAVMAGIAERSHTAPRDDPSQPVSQTTPVLDMTPAEFAHERHAGTFRKGTDLPYIVHPAGVARILARHYPGDGDLEAAGWLHDTLEDTPTTGDELDSRFGAEVRRLVEAVTKRDGEAFHAPTDRGAMRLKAADALDNVTATLEGLRRGEAVFERFKQGVRKVEHWQAIAEAADRLLTTEPLAAELRAAVTEVTAFVPPSTPAERA